MVPKGWALLGALAAVAARIGVGLLLAGRDTAPARTVVREVERPPPPSLTEPSTAPRPDDGAWPEDPVEQLDRFARQLRWSEALRRTAVTGEDGAFVLDRLPDEPHPLSASKRGRRVRAKRAGDARPGATVEFTAEPAIVARARLVPPAEAADARPTVEARAGSTSRRVGARDGVAELELPPGDWTLRATAGACSELTSEPVAVKLVEGAGTVEGTLALSALSGVRGRILIDWGRPLRSQLDVRAVAIGPQGNAEGVSFSANARRASLREREDGFDYAFVDLAPGRLALADLRDPRGQTNAAAAVESVEVGAGVVARDIVVPPPPRSEYAVVHVAGPDGEAAREVDFTTSFRSPRRSTSGGGVAYRRTDGAHLVLHADDAATDPSEAEWSIGVRAAQLGLSLRDPLTDAERKRPDRSFSRRPSRPDGRRRRTFGPSQTGPQELVVTHGGHAGAVLAVHRIALEPGENRLEIPVPVAHPLPVRASGAGATVPLQPADPGAEWFLAMENADATGLALFPALAPGRYIVRSGGKETVAEVRGPTEVAVDG